MSTFRATIQSIAGVADSMALPVRVLRDPCFYRSETESSFSPQTIEENDSNGSYDIHHLAQMNRPGF